MFIPFQVFARSLSCQKGPSPYPRINNLEKILLAVSAVAVIGGLGGMTALFIMGNPNFACAALVGTALGGVAWVLTSEHLSFRKSKQLTLPAEEIEEDIDGATSPDATSETEETAEEEEDLEDSRKGERGDTVSGIRINSDESADKMQPNSIVTIGPVAVLDSPAYLPVVRLSIDIIEETVPFFTSNHFSDNDSTEYQLPSPSQIEASEEVVILRNQKVVVSLAPVTSFLKPSCGFIPSAKINLIEETVPFFTSNHFSDNDSTEYQLPSPSRIEASEEVAILPNPKVVVSLPKEQFVSESLTFVAVKETSFEQDAFNDSGLMQKVHDTKQKFKEHRIRSAYLDLKLDVEDLLFNIFSEHGHENWRYASLLNLFYRLYREPETREEFCEFIKGKVNSELESSSKNEEEEVKDQQIKQLARSFFSSFESLFALFVEGDKNLKRVLFYFIIDNCHNFYEDKNVKQAFSLLFQCLSSDFSDESLEYFVDIIINKKQESKEQLDFFLTETELEATIDIINKVYPDFESAVLDIHKQLPGILDKQELQFYKSTAVIISSIVEQVKKYFCDDSPGNVCIKSYLLNRALRTGDKGIVKELGNQIINFVAAYMREMKIDLRNFETFMKRNIENEEMLDVSEMLNENKIDPRAAPFIKTLFPLPDTIGVLLTLVFGARNFTELAPYLENSVMPIAEDKEHLKKILQVLNIITEAIQPQEKKKTWLGWGVGLIVSPSTAIRKAIGGIGLTLSGADKVDFKNYSPILEFLLLGAYGDDREKQVFNRFEEKLLDLYKKLYAFDFEENAENPSLLRHHIQTTLNSVVEQKNNRTSKSKKKKYS